jgi:hypothetical protein
MKDLTYQAYLADPAVREALDREVDRFRHEAIDQFIVSPLVEMFRRTFTRRRPKPMAEGAASELA